MLKYLLRVVLRLHRSLHIYEFRPSHCLECFWCSHLSRLSYLASITSLYPHPRPLSFSSVELSSMGRMEPISKSWYYWVMFGLLLAQVGLAVNYHVLVCNMLIANTLLLLVIMFHHGYTLGDQAGPLFYRLCGCVAFLAVLFVNITHALELFTDYGSSHSHGGEDDDHEHHNESNYVFIPRPYLFVSIADVFIKCLVMVLGKVPALGLPVVLRLVLHTLCPLTVIGFYYLGSVIPSSFGDGWLWQHTDPVAAVVMVLVYFVLILPAFREILPYIFADTPVAFNEDNFKEEITAKFPDVTCPHIHAYRLWPGNLFDALLHINIQVAKDDPSWSKKAAERYEEVLKNVNSVLKKAGAQKISVEPRFADVTEGSNGWKGCRDNCFRPDMSCCPNASPPAKHEV